MKNIDANPRPKRRSRKRDAILDLMRSGKLDHPTADDIYRTIRLSYPNISLGTVYRNLNEMSCEGVVAKLPHQGDADRFDHVVEPHMHFRCKICGALIDVPSQSALAEMASNLESLGLVVDDISVSFSGVCSKCAKKFQQNIKHNNKERYQNEGTKGNKNRS